MGMNETPSSASSDEPMPVVKVLSVRGVEYLFMSICLWIGAGSLTGLLLSLVNGMTGFAALSFPVSTLLVTLPIFAFLFLRLKKAELAQPSLRLDASKRRLSQITQLLAFIVCLVNLITLVYLLMNMVGGEDSGVSVGKLFINVFIIFLVAGGILAYYWHDEHRRRA